MDVQGPFFTLAVAAEYCGYKSREHFAELLRGYVVPKFGEQRTRPRTVQQLVASGRLRIVEGKSRVVR